MSTPTAVLVLYNAPRTDAHTPGHEADAGVLAEVNAVVDALQRAGHRARPVAVSTLREAGTTLHTAPETAVFNLVESLRPDEADAALVPAVAAALGKTCSGAGTRCQTLAFDKWQARACLSAHGVCVPAAVLAPPGGVPLPTDLPPGPLIVKPVRADASEGIGEDSVLAVPTAERLRALTAAVHRHFGQPALIEQFIDGREFNVSVIDHGGTVRVLPIAEIEFVDYADGRPRIVDYAAKWQPESFAYHHTPRRLPASLDAPTATAIGALARSAWDALGCTGYARVDMRLGTDGRAYVIEVNPNPDISPDAGFAAALAAAGIPYTDFVCGQLGLSPCPPPPETGAAPAIHWTRPDEVEPLVSLLADTGVFRPGELAIAREVLEEAVRHGPAGHYQSYTALADGVPAGWVCIGPTPCTEGTFDLYWMAVSPRCARRGIGSLLMHTALTESTRHGARLLVIETSSRPDYAPARAFYERHGCREAARVDAFYAPGDDKIVYLKPLTTPPTP